MPGCPAAVGTVSGATITTRAFLEAMENALAK
ncbi:MAG: FMN-binding protein [Bacillota bacterium]